MEIITIGDRIKVVSGHLRGYFGTITEPDNGDGYGVAIDYSIVFVRLPESDFNVANTHNEKWIAGSRK